jgi:hypothetical protein
VKSVRYERKKRIARTTAIPNEKNDKNERSFDRWCREEKSGAKMNGWSV